MHNQCTLGIHFIAAGVFYVVSFKRLFHKYLYNLRQFTKIDPSTLSVSYQQMNINTLLNRFSIFLNGTIVGLPFDLSVDLRQKHDLNQN